MYNFDLGPWSRKITTASPEAQVWFDRGLNWTYGYNHEEAISCFHQALVHDPNCAMAWWGIAYAAGPFYNRAWVRFSRAELDEVVPMCYEAAKAAFERVQGCTSAERGLIEAITQRYQQAEERDYAVLDQWHWEFTEAMRKVYTQHPDDLDIAALFMEAAVTCTPRQLWNLQTGEPRPNTFIQEVMDVMGQAMAQIEATGIPHPGVLHMSIHALEMAPFPEQAIKAADMLRGFAPDAGHLEHMPAHIYVLCGDYAQSVAQSVRAVQADDKYLAYAGDSNFYTTARCHDLHLLMYSAMFLGQYRTALHAVERICDIATSELIDKSPPFMASILDGYSAMKHHVWVRFGRWHDLIAAPAVDFDRRPIGAAMHAYGQGVAHAALGQIEEAEAAQAKFAEIRSSIPPDAIFLSNPIQDMLAIGEAMLTGELEYRKGGFDEAFVALQLAVARDDALNYTEPWAWMHPPRHALGALLAEQGHFAEAEAVYRADLGYDDNLPRCCQHPDNVWALQGLVECVEQLGGGKNELHLLRQRLTIAQARTDIPIETSCFCRVLD